MKKPESASDTAPAAEPADWEIIRRSRPEDYDGHTEFDRMTPAARLAWLETAAEFVSRQIHRKPEQGHGSPVKKSE